MANHVIDEKFFGNHAKGDKMFYCLRHSFSLAAPFLTLFMLYFVFAKCIPALDPGRRRAGFEPEGQGRHKVARHSARHVSVALSQDLCAGALMTQAAKQV